MFASRLNLNSGEKILQTLWVGSLWAIGYLAVPTLFGTLQDRQTAGLLAGKMFTSVSYVGLFCAVLLLLSAFRNSKRAATDKRIWILIVMLGLVIAGEFVFQPLMAELKLSGIAEGTAAALKFDKYHHIATVLYLINSLLGLALVVFDNYNAVER